MNIAEELINTLITNDITNKVLTPIVLDVVDGFCTAREERLRIRELERLKREAQRREEETEQKIKEAHAILKSPSIKKRSFEDLKEENNGYKTVYFSDYNNNNEIKDEYNIKKESKDEYNIKKEYKSKKEHYNQDFEFREEYKETKRKKRKSIHVSDEDEPVDYNQMMTEKNEETPLLKAKKAIQKEPALPLKKKKLQEWNEDHFAMDTEPNPFQDTTPPLHSKVYPSLKDEIIEKLNEFDDSVNCASNANSNVNSIVDIFDSQCKEDIGFLSTALHLLFNENVKDFDSIVRVLASKEAQKKPIFVQELSSPRGSEPNHFGNYMGTNKSGCARTEGYYTIPMQERSSYLSFRNPTKQTTVVATIEKELKVSLLIMVEKYIFF